MPELSWSFAMSVVALGFYSSSYFFNNKKIYLILQTSGCAFLALSYLLMGLYFTMISLVIGIARGVIYYLYEIKDKSVPIYVVGGVCLASVVSYIIINFVILSNASPWDVLSLFAACMYAITFAIRDVRTMRYIVLIPHASAIAYNLIISAPISTAISYLIETAVTVVAIVKDEIQRYRARRQKS